jgi:hypothetical protein
VGTEPDYRELRSDVLSSLHPIFKAKRLRWLHFGDTDNPLDRGFSNDTVCMLTYNSPV